MARRLSSYRSNSEAPAMGRGRVRRAIGEAGAEEHVRLRRLVNLTEMQIGIAGLKGGQEIRAHEQQRKAIKDLQKLHHRVSDARRRHQHAHWHAAHTRPPKQA